MAKKVATAGKMDNSEKVAKATKNSKNAELKLLFPEQMKSGKPFVYSIESGKKKKDTQGNSYMMMYFVQKVIVESANLDEIDQELTGWSGNERYLRTLKKMHVDHLKNNPDLKARYNIGVLHDDKGIFIREFTEPQYEGHLPKVLPAREGQDEDIYFVTTDEDGDLAFIYEDTVIKMLKKNGKDSEEAKNKKLPSEKKTLTEVKKFIAKDELPDIFAEVDEDESEEEEDEDDE